jgi:hypothetical protein
MHGVIEPRITRYSADESPDPVDLAEKLNLKPAITNMGKHARRKRASQFRYPYHGHRAEQRNRALGNSDDGTNLTHGLQVPFPDWRDSGKLGIELDGNSGTQNVTDRPDPGWLT